jgi:histidine triad (HIT) family protein
MRCVFCRIAAREVPAEVVYEDDRVIAFLDINPLNPGHTLVVPKVHVERLSDLPAELCGPLLGAASRLARAAREALGAAGVNLVVNDGRAAGQAVPHLHLHLVPRFPGDGGRSLHSLLPVRHGLDLPEIARKLRDGISPR